MTVHADRTTFLEGSDGYLTIDTPWFSNGLLELVRNGERETIEAQSSLQPYALEAAAFADVVQQAAPPWITRADSVGNMCVLDRLRERLKPYPRPQRP